MRIKPGALGHVLSAKPPPADWTVTTVRALGRIVGGATPDSDESSFWRGGTIPWATPTDITALRSRYISETETKITEAGLNGCAAQLLPEGSILYTSRATIGAKAINTVPMATNQGFASFIPGPEINRDFLFDYLDLLTPAFIRLGAGTTFLEVSKRDMRKVQCALPLPDEQAAIARILDAADTAIERARVAVEKAGRLRVGILQRFFANGLGNTNSADRHIGAPADGWRLMPASELLVEPPKNGISPAASSQPPGLPTFSIAAVRSGRVNLASGEHLKYVRLDAKQAERFAIHRGDLLVVRGNANPDLVGRCGVVDEFPAGCIYPDILIRLVFKSGEDGLLPRYAATVWNHHLVHNQVLKRAKTSNGTLKINGKDIRRIIIPVPPYAAQVELSTHLEQVDAVESAYERRLAALERLKRGLMQDLLTGRVRVKLPAAVPIPAA